MIAWSDSQRVMLNLLASHLFGSELALPEQVDWSQVFRESLEQTVFPQVYDSAKPYLPSSQRQALDRRFYQLLAGNLTVDHGHARVHSMMTEAGIPYVILKGAASARYYPQPELRQMGDVDFLVPEERLEDAGNVLLQNGMERSEDDHEHGFHQVYQGDRITWELHWAAPGIPSKGGETVQAYMDDILARAQLVQLDELCYLVPSEFHHGLVLLLHTAEHLTASGIGLRHLCDWVVFAGHFSDGQFRELFEAPLRETGLWDFARTLTAMGAEYLGGPSPAWAAGVDRRLTEEMMDDILSSGNFGAKDSQRINQYKLIQNRDSLQVGNAGMLRHLFSHLNSHARASMPVLGRLPVLLPVGWIYISIRHIVWIIQGKRPRLHLRRTVDGAKRRNQLYRQLRLFE